MSFLHTEGQFLDKVPFLTGASEPDFYQLIRLFVQDIDSFFKTNVISVETDENKHCIAVPKENYELKNTMFDGQGLIDESIFPKWGEGYILLRHHMCKMACFKTKIQKFFKDYYGDNYNTATIKDMFGNDHYVKDIELITTDNAMKWLNKMGRLIRNN